MSKVSKFIKYAFNNHPIITNSLIYGTLYVGAEFSQQTVSKKIGAQTPQDYDTTTIGRYAFFGTTIQGPLLTLCKEPVVYDHQMLKCFGILGVAVFAPVYHNWYKWLDKRFVGTSYKIVAKKLLLDQFLMTPQLLVLFYIAMSIMERKKDILEECKQKFLPTFKSSCMFWLPAQSVNFFLIPAAYRVVYVGSCSFVWVNILCWIKRQEY